MKFTKMHGCGNDYVYVDAIHQTIENPNDVSIKVSDRHFGIGSDGLIMILPSEVADFRMRMFNADGSEGKMCGNGIRCVAKFVYDKGLTQKKQISVETLSGIKYLDLTIEDGVCTWVTVDMGEPILVPEQIPVKSEQKERFVAQKVNVGGNEVTMTCVSMGNPHAIIFVPETESLDLEKIGPVYEKHEIFPEQVNTEFIELVDEHTIRMRVWERGSGETLACGTGACASVVACILNGKTKDEVLVHLLGGDLKIRYDKETNHVFMTGPATTVFEGEIAI